MRRAPAKGTAAKHAGTGKHATGRGKHHPAAAKTPHHAGGGQRAVAVAKPPAAAKPRRLARAEPRVRPGITPFPEEDSSSRERPDGPGARAVLAEVPCCAAAAVAASLRLSGRACGPGDILALHRLAGGGDGEGVPVEAALDAASRRGLGGVRPASFAPVCPGGPAAGTVLGVDLPGPHAVTVAPDGCWLSWGEHYDPAGWPGAVVEEAWQVTWP